MSGALLLAVASVVLMLAVVLAALVWAARGPGAVRDPREVDRQQRHQHRRHGQVSGSRVR